MTSISRVTNLSSPVRRRPCDGEGRRCGAARRAFTTSLHVSGLGDVKGRRLLLRVHHRLGKSMRCASTSSRLRRPRGERTLARAEPTAHSFNALLLQGTSLFRHCIRGTLVVVLLVVLVVPFFVCDKNNVYIFSFPLIPFGSPAPHLPGGPLLLPLLLSTSAALYRGASKVAKETGRGEDSGGLGAGALRGALSALPKGMWFGIGAVWCYWITSTQLGGTF